MNIYTITDWDRRYYVQRLLIRMGHTSLDTFITVVENGVGGKKDALLKFLEETTELENFEVVSCAKRRGLASVWNMCMQDTRSESALILNDDCMPLPNWESSLRHVMQHNMHRMFTICHPNGFSGFVLNKAFWEKHSYFNNEFPEGYYEDDDWFLKIAYQEGMTKEEVFDKLIYSHYDRTGKSLFQHVPDTAPLRGHRLRKWNKTANAEVFHKSWKEVAPGTENAIQNKGGKWYLYIGTEYEKF